MKANEFVKKFGWGWAKDVVNNQPKTDAQIFNPYNQKYSSSYNIKKGVSVAWLKRLIESHDLVESYGGVDKIKEDTADLEDWEESSSLWREVEKAIFDVESCQ